MSAERNSGRLMPWEDTAKCDKATCSGPMVPVGKMTNGHTGPRGSRIACVACGTARVGTPQDVAKAEAAQRAWELYEAGLIHPDKGCARCNGPLTLDRARLCAPCVDADNAERQAALFPEVR